MPVPQTNSLLDALSPANRDHILSLAKHVTLPVRENLIEPEMPLQFAYFMTSGVASVVIELAVGGTAEVALIGREGLVGGLDLLGPAQTPSRCFIQVPATAYRMPFSELRRFFFQCEEIRMRILEMVQQQAMAMSQLAACNKLHEAEPRLARWLLMVQDRVEDDTLNLTQEFLAQMLGTQRTTVALVAGALQRSGMIEYKRGRVKILCREDLESAACECYGIAHRLLKNLYRGKVDDNF